MSLPNDFASDIKDEYGNFGWQLANCFSFVAEFLGHKVYDLSAVETALKIVATETGSSLVDQNPPEDLPEYLKTFYPKVHKVFTRRAKTLNLSDEDEEQQRQLTVTGKFANYCLAKEVGFFDFMIDEFFKIFVIGTLIVSMFDWLVDIEEIIIEQTEDS